MRHINSKEAETREKQGRKKKGKYEDRNYSILPFCGIFLSMNPYLQHFALVSGFAHFSLAEKFPGQNFLFTVVLYKVGK